MIRVVHVGKFYRPVSGGMERALQTICEAERTVVDSRALVANRGGPTVHEVINGVPVTRVRSVGGIGAVEVCPSFPLWLRRQEPDVLVMHEPNPVALVAYALARPRARTVVWFHADVVRPTWRYRSFYRPFERPVLERARRIVVSSSRLAEHSRALADFQSKIVVIPFGIDPAPYQLDGETALRVAGIRQRHPGAIVLFVGRMVPYKGLDVLVRALQGIDATLILAGDGPSRPALEQLATDVGVGARVVFAGRVSDDEVRALYQACDVFALPSVTRAEAFGVVQLEAMAAGKPVVSTNLTSGVPWVNRDGETGLVVPPGDATALRGALAHLLGDADLRARLGRAGQARVASTFTVARMVAATTALYRSLLEEGDHVELSVGRAP